MRTVVEKCSQQVALQLLEVVDVALYCLDHELLKKRNLLMEVLPSLARYVYTSSWDKFQLCMLCM